MNKRIYLDYSASTPVDKEVEKVMRPYFSIHFGNPSSIHFFGQENQIAIDESRNKIAKYLKCQNQEIIFTGSATEANNLALKGTLIYLKKKFPEQKLHFITSQIEHEAVLKPCLYLENYWGIETDYIKPEKNGIIDAKNIEKILKENTVLVSIMYVNNEIGAIQPIKEIAQIIKKVRNERQKNKNNLPLIFHTDAVQALNYLDCRPNFLGVDLMTFSGHKIYGPKGIGFLYKKIGLNLIPLIHGGHQEYELRGGTENVAYIVGIGKAVELLTKNKSKIKKIKSFQDYLKKEIFKNIKGVKLNGDENLRVPNILNFTFEGIDGESLIFALDQEGIAVSSGAACAAKSQKPSHVLLAIGLSEKEAKSSIRVSMGRFTTLPELKIFIKKLKKIIEKLRKLN